MLTKVNTYLNTYTGAAPLAVFRILFGLLMVISILRFASNGWIDSLYITPQFHFTYYGFEWVQPLGQWMYALFFICGVAALGVALGYKYRISIVVFFITFTYIELIDKTTYLNHYYFISCVAFILCFLPANSYFSLDARLNPIKAYAQIPRWTIDCLKLLLCIVYFYAGLAKLNSDWLLHAMPLKIWLPANYDTPIIGQLLQQPWMHYAFSYGGALYDLLIPFLLLHKRTRLLGFVFVVVFHVLTRVLFPIGVFPVVMIFSALIFFDTQVHNKILDFIAKLFCLKTENLGYIFNHKKPKTTSKMAFSFVAVFMFIQLALPWRYLAYPNELFWTEEGYRFSWRVMLMEKAGYAQFIIKDKENGKTFYVNNADFLTPFQEKQMSTQPDFIVEYAHFLGKHFNNQGHKNIAVFVESYVALNGRISQPYVNPTIDLLQVEDTFATRDWLLPFNDTIKGL